MQSTKGFPFVQLPTVAEFAPLFLMHTSTARVSFRSPLCGPTYHPEVDKVMIHQIRNKTCDQNINLLVLRRCGAALPRLGLGLAEWNSPGGASAPATETQALQCSIEFIYYLYVILHLPTKPIEPIKPIAYHIFLRDAGNQVTTRSRV